MATQTKIDTEKLLQTFLDLVRLDSPSGQEEPVRLYLEKRFHDLGLAFQVDAAGNLIVKIPGHASKSNLKLVMTGHMDVVPPCIGVNPVVEGKGEDRQIRSSGDTVLGADDKSGLSPMLEALAYSLENSLPRPDLLYLITTREEVMLSGAKEMDKSHYQDADFAIAFDHTGEQGTLIYEAPTYIKFELTVRGKSVHAGIMPEKGINAIQILSRVIEKLHLGRIDENTTSNIGFIRGGKATNIVPDLAIAEGELRGHDDARIQKELEHIQTTLKELVGYVDGASCEYSESVEFTHYQTDPEHFCIGRVRQAMESTGLTPKLIRTNGGSDVNVFADNGVPGIVLSAGYIAPHSTEERVFLKDMVTCTDLILNIWEAFTH